MINNITSSVSSPYTGQTDNNSGAHIQPIPSTTLPEISSEQKNNAVDTMQARIDNARTQIETHKQKRMATNVR